MLFSLFQMSTRIRFRQRIIKKKTVFFSAQRAHWIFADFRKKNSRDKKNSEKNKFISGHKKHFSSFVFFVALINIFSNRSKVFFYFVALITFSRNLSNVFLSRRPH